MSVQGATTHGTVGQENAKYMRLREGLAMRQVKQRVCMTSAADQSLVLMLSRMKYSQESAGPTLIECYKSSGQR